VHVEPSHGCLRACALLQEKSEKTVTLLHGSLNGCVLCVPAPSQGKPSRDFAEELGYVGSEEVVHRDNICQLTQRRAASEDGASGTSRAASPTPAAAGPEPRRPPPSGPAPGPLPPGAGAGGGPASGRASPAPQAGAPPGSDAPHVGGHAGGSGGGPARHAPQKTPRAGPPSGRDSPGGGDGPGGSSTAPWEAPDRRSLGSGGGAHGGVSPEDVAGRLALLRCGGAQVVADCARGGCEASMEQRSQG